MGPSPRPSATPGAAFPDRPALAAAAIDLPDPSSRAGGWAYEPKLDGWRGLIHHDGARARIRSRHGTDLTSAFPDIAAAATAQLGPGDVVDGELVIWREGRIEFTALSARAGGGRRAQAAAAREPATFAVFDILAHAGEDLTRRPLRRRRHLLDELATGWAPPIQLIPQTTDVDVARGWMVDYRAADAGVEGVVAKPLTSTYRPGRRDWVKVRIRDTREAVVGAVIGTSQLRLVLGLPTQGGGLKVAGTTVPLGAAQRAILRPALRPLERPDLSSGEPATAHPWPAGMTVLVGGFGTDPVPVRLVVPDVVVEVDADTAFDHGRWRHSPRLIRPRPDLAPGDLEPLGDT